MKTKWYVLHVLTGSEPEVRRQLEARGFTAIIPAEDRMIRHRGQWIQKEYRLFPGYVFVHMAYNLASHHRVCNIPAVIQMLPKDKPQPLTPKEAAWVITLGSGLLTPSTVDFSGQTPRIVDGPLLGLQNGIVKIDHHRLRALVRVMVLGESKQIELSIRPV